MNRMGATASGIERAVFGVRSTDEIDGWLATHVRDRLGSELGQVLFRSGRISAVYGAELVNGRRIAVKAHRNPADRRYLAASAQCQRLLAEAGFPCATPLDGPTVTEGVTAGIETLLEGGERGDGHDPATRRAIAYALHAQLAPLRGLPVDDLLVGAPAWSRHADGPWPEPHDPIFDFTTTPTGFTWLDELARRAAEVLADCGPPNSIAHADWSCQNIVVTDGRVSAAYDWDSVAAAPEPVLAGLSAGSFTFGSAARDQAPGVADVTAFLRDYEIARERAFTAAEQRFTAAAATWVLAYNARCEVAFLGPHGRARDGSALRALQADGDSYLQLRWDTERPVTEQATRSP